jgi:hypothetical protein
MSWKPFASRALGESCTDRTVAALKVRFLRAGWGPSSDREGPSIYSINRGDIARY